MRYLADIIRHGKQCAHQTQRHKQHGQQRQPLHPSRVNNADSGCDYRGQPVDAALILFHLREYKAEFNSEWVQGGGSGEQTGGVVSLRGRAEVSSSWSLEKSCLRLDDHLAVLRYQATPGVQLVENDIDLDLSEELLGMRNFPVDLGEASLDVLAHGEPFGRGEAQEGNGWDAGRVNLGAGGVMAKNGVGMSGPEEEVREEGCRGRGWGIGVRKCCASCQTGDA